MFEPGIAETTSAGAIHEMAAHFSLAEGVVDELDLNTRIWTKGVDESLLRAADDTREDAFDQLAARGNVTATELWQAATAAVGDKDDEADAVAQPPDTSIRIEHSGGSSSVHYGLSAGFFVAVLLSVASAGVAAATARALPAALDISGLAAWTARIPEVPGIPDVVVSNPIPFFIVAAIVLPISLLVWVFRVRRVEVAPDAVRISRGLRPWPRTYPRPLYGKVVRVDKAVFIGKSEGLNLVNPSASPMLSEAESKWVAAELRRALRATAH